MWDPARLGLLVQDKPSGCGTAELAQLPWNGDKSSPSRAEQDQHWELSQGSFGRWFRLSLSLLREKSGKRNLGKNIAEFICRTQPLRATRSRQLFYWERASKKCVFISGIHGQSVLRQHWGLS